MPVIINEFEIEFDDGDEPRETPPRPDRGAASAPPSPLVLHDIEDWRRSRELRLADD